MSTAQTAFADICLFVNRNVPRAKNTILSSVIANNSNITSLRPAPRFNISSNAEIECVVGRMSFTFTDVPAISRIRMSGSGNVIKENRTKRAVKGICLFQGGSQLRVHREIIYLSFVII